MTLPPNIRRRLQDVMCQLAAEQHPGYRWVPVTEEAHERSAAEDDSSAEAKRD
jgi:hypothetical protein